LPLGRMRKFAPSGGRKKAARTGGDRSRWASKGPTGQSILKQKKQKKAQPECEKGAI